MPWFDDMTGYSTGAQVSILLVAQLAQRFSQLNIVIGIVIIHTRNNLTFQVKYLKLTGVIQYIYNKSLVYFMDSLHQLE